VWMIFNWSNLGVFISTAIWMLQLLLFMLIGTFSDGSNVFFVCLKFC